MNTIITKTIAIVGFAMTLALADITTNSVQANVIKSPPIVTRLQRTRPALSKQTIKWLKRWNGVNLDAPGFVYNELSGTTQIYLKIRKIDASSSDGYKAYGTFVTGHGSSNPDAEIAYFNMAAILGYDGLMRQAIPYTLGPKAAKGFKTLLEKELAVTDPSSRRVARINRLLDWLKVPPLLGGLKANKDDSYTEYKMASIPPGAGRGDPLKTNPIIRALQASNPQPVGGKIIQLKPGYSGDLLELAREYSIVMTLDVLFQQWDRYNNTNIALSKDFMGTAHFYMTDNGGADIDDDYESVTAFKKNLNYFSRYDRDTIIKLREIYAFLNKPARGFMGYKNAVTFVSDLGLYSERKPADYLTRFKLNLKIFLSRVAANERKYGDKAYLPPF